jgi:hypothetical protein
MEFPDEEAADPRKVTRYIGCDNSLFEEAPFAWGGFCARTVGLMPATSGNWWWICFEMAVIVLGSNMGVYFG